MKYHTTISTIVTSVLVLLVFASCALFCVFSLGIGSPGMIAVSQIGRLLPEDSPLSFSFSSVDRNMSRLIRINDLSVSWEGMEVATADALTLYQNPWQVIVGVVTGKGSADIDVEGLAIDIDPLIADGEGGGGPTMSLDDVNNLLRGLESYTYLVEDYFFYNWAFSLNISDFDLRLGPELSFSGLRMNLSLKPGLELDSFVFNAPLISVDLVDGGLEGEDMSLTFSKDTSGYSARASLAEVSLDFRGLAFSGASPALRLDFADFESLDIRNLPLTLSAGVCSGSYGGWAFGADAISASAREGGMDIAAITAEATGPDFQAEIPRLDAGLGISEDGEGLLVTLLAPGGAAVSGFGGLSLSTGILSAEAEFGSSMTFRLGAPQANFGGLSEVTGASLDSLSVTSLSVSGQSNMDDLFAEGSFDLSAASAVDFLDSSEAGVSFSLIFSGGSLEDITIDLPRLDFGATGGDPLSASVRYTAASGLSGSVSWGDMLSLSAASGEQNRVTLEISSMPLEILSPLISQYVPQLSSYMDSSTSLHGSAELGYDLADGFTGQVNGSIALSGIRFNESSFGAAALIDVSFGPDGLTIPSLTLTTEWVRLSYSGSLSFDTNLPQGNLGLDMTSSGERILNIDFILDSEDEYHVDATIPRFSSSYLRGSVNWARDGVIYSAGELRSGSTDYPFDLTIDINNARADLISSGVVASVDFSDIIDITLSFADFALPFTNTASSMPTTIDGGFRYTFDVAGQSLAGSAEGFAVRDIAGLPSSPDIVFDLRLANDVVEFGRISFEDSFEPYTGSAVYTFGERSFAMTLGNSSERMNLSLLLRPGDYSGILTLRDISLDRFGVSGTKVNTTLVGRGSDASDFSFSGAVNISGGDFTLLADAIFDNEGFKAENVVYTSGGMTLTGESFGVDFAAGAASGDVLFAYDRVNSDRTYPIRAQLYFDLSFATGDGIVDTAVALWQSGGQGFSVSLRIDYFDLDSGVIRLEDRTVSLVHAGDELAISGDLLNGTIRLDDLTLDLRIEENPVTYGTISGRYTPTDFDITLTDVMFNLGAINWLFPLPLVNFDNEAWVGGDFIAFGNTDDYHLYGQASSDGFDMRVWYVEDSVLRIGDVQATVVDNHARTTLTPVVVIDPDGGLHEASAVAQAWLGDTMDEKLYQVDCYIRPGEDIRVRVPIKSANVELSGDVSGHFVIGGTSDKVELGGELDISGGLLSVGMAPLPDWWLRDRKGRMMYRNDFEITLSGNNQFVLPLGPNPILSAWFDEGCNFSILIDRETGEKDVGGSLSFRSGEIYYFQKNFFITEGSLFFPERSTGGGLLSPEINLRARLRDYTSDGQRVDIYLVLNNATLSGVAGALGAGAAGGATGEVGTTFSPFFESSPQLPLEEIMSILGSSIIPSTQTAAGNLGQVAGLLSSGLDIMNRVGIINTTGEGGVVDVVRDSLGIDIFSMRTSIIENFLLDTLFRTGNDNYSPLATYLNNTSIYIGKYLGDNFYFQAMFYLEAVDEATNTSGFLANDLSLDFELSLEWENPLGAVTFFTTPTYISPYNFFDNFGISFTKTIDY